MLVIRDMMNQDVRLSEDTELHGMIDGSVLVPEGTVFHLRGMVNGSVVVEGGTAFVHGTVGETLINRGGTVELFGWVHGRLITESGTTRIDKDAKVDEGVVDYTKA